MIIESKINTGSFKKNNMVYARLHYPDFPFGAYYDIVDDAQRYIYFSPNQTFELLNIIKKLNVNECLKNLRIEAFVGKPDGQKNMITLSTSKICFDCDKKHTKNNSAIYDTYSCIKNMRDGKCPYDLARMLFPDAYQKVK